MRSFLFSIAFAVTAIADDFNKCIKSALGSKTELYAFPFSFPNSLEDPLYAISDVHPYNLDYQYKPAAVTYPTTPEQVAAVVKCGNQFKKAVQARSGGHSFLNYGLGGADGALVIDMKHLDGFQYNAANGTATFGPGNKLGPLTDKLEKVGRTMAYGENADVGAGGHITIGGIGLMSRQLGLALDQVVSMQCVLANGTIVTASSSTNSDLFWALRGAGASFAIVTSFTAKTVPTFPVTCFTYNITTGRSADLAVAWKAWQDFVAQPGLDRLFGCTITLTPGLSGAMMLFQGTYFGPKEGLDKLRIEKMLPQNKPGFSITSIISASTVNEVMGSLQDALGVVPSHFYAKSLKFTNQTLLSTSQAEDMFAYIDKTTKGTPLWFIIWDLEGGAIADPSQSSTAYWHRDALFFMTSYVIDIFSLKKVNSGAKDFLNELNNKVRSLRSGIDESAYPGYVDYNLTNPQIAYWGENVERLRSIKKAVDPGNLFRNPQSIPI